MADKPTHVRQAYNELANGIRTGAEDSVTAARKRLDAAGEDGAAAETAERKRWAAEESQEGKRAAAAERRAAVQADVDKAKAEAEAKADAKADAAEAKAEAKADAAEAKAEAAAAPPVGRSTKPQSTT